MKSLDQEVSLLRRVPLFAHVESSKLKLLAFTSERLTFEEGQYLFQQGDNGDAAYVIMDGTADAIVGTVDNPMVVAHFKANDFVGEIAILCDVPRTAGVLATSRVETLRIGKEQFLKLVTEFPDIAVEMMRVLADRLARTTTELTQARAAAR